MSRLVRGRPRVRLLAVADGSLTGYQACVVQPAYDWEDGARDTDGDQIIRRGPFSDAGLVARSIAIDWAAEQALPFEDR